MAAEYYTKTIINANSIIVETMIGSNRYYATIMRNHEEDLALAEHALTTKVRACTLLNVDSNVAAQTYRVARNAQTPIALSTTAVE